MRLDQNISRINYEAFLWHAIFLSLAHSFMDIDTVLPVLVHEVGGRSVHVGMLTAIMIGGPTLTRLLFTPFLNNRPRKKKLLIVGIGIRVFSLYGMGVLVGLLEGVSTQVSLTLIFILLASFAFGGAFASISYTDILGKSVLPDKRKSFFSLRQSLTNAGVFLSALAVGKVLVWIDFPANYSWLFITAGFFLTVASFGFFRIREITVEVDRISGFGGLIRSVRREVLANRKLKYYILMVNTLGVSLSLLPFLMMHLKAHFGVDNRTVGSFLLLKVTSAVLIGFLFYRFSRRIRYDALLYFTAGLGGLLIIFTFTGLGIDHPALLFVAGGLMLTSYKVATDGVLLEVSSDQNRTLYAGMAGVANILPALFPLIGGFVMDRLGLEAFFAIIAMLLILSSVFVYRLDCRR